MKCLLNKCVYCHVNKSNEFVCENDNTIVDELTVCDVEISDEINIFDDLYYTHECEKDYGYDGEY